ncbi:uncharacterized protein B0I36DRAFT_349444 [Microdochium trichocladiopsis]|uniref:NodB homology domain-containing protein n=1 Tax=Microdochium trichocladiopsis TaxID=1682393 RepID=A0A9P8Y732_9PEZI|nr:uncharacterized protein B0I36DRAFT_349444 [Microdochium trichocladiopsis]KAH7031360.1 hypothetical protein B0I36DRAFT_349444 [Microdochium trichocladiopsis]
MLPTTLLEAILIASPLVAAHGSHHEHRDHASISPRAPPPGKDTSKLNRPKLGSVPYGPNIQSCTIPGKVALTFDDGPAGYTGAVLDLLAKNNVKATFFLNANNVEGLITNKQVYRDVVKRMFNEGHHIGSHSYTHADFDLISTQQRREEIIYNEIAIADILGVFPTYFRPPYTHCNGGCQADIVALGYHVSNYNLDTKDWEGDYNKARQNFVGALASGNPGFNSFISLAHDIHEETAKTLVQFMIDQARKYKYELTTMGDCLGDAHTNWYRNADTGAAWNGRPLPADEPEETTTSTSLTPTPTPTSTSTSTSSTSSAAQTSSAPASTVTSTSSSAATSTGSSASVKQSTTSHANGKPTDSVSSQTSPSTTPTDAPPSSGFSPVRDGASGVGLALALFVGLLMF